MGPPVRPPASSAGSVEPSVPREAMAWAAVEPAEAAATAKRMAAKAENLRAIAAPPRRRPRATIHGSRAASVMVRANSGAIRSVAPRRGTTSARPRSKLSVAAFARAEAKGPVARDASSVSSISRAGAGAEEEATGRAEGALGGVHGQVSVAPNLRLRSDHPGERAGPGPLPRPRRTARGAVLRTAGVPGFSQLEPAHAPDGSPVPPALGFFFDSCNGLAGPST